jgi:hypothetical protein
MALSCVENVISHFDGTLDQSLVVNRKALAERASS